LGQIYKRTRVFDEYATNCGVANNDDGLAFALENTTDLG
jgi:hypothetical protein